jgi:DNA repair ATPase RecN
MTNKKKFFAELKKRENAEKFGLKAKKIELGINDDLAEKTEQSKYEIKTVLDAISEASGVLGNAMDAIRNLRDIQQYLRQFSDSLNETMGELNALTRNAEVAAEDLGIQPENLSNYNAAQEAINEISSTMEKSNDIDVEIMQFVD